MTQLVDDIILAVLDSGAPVHQASIHAVIAAIPNHLLVELAIERGALVFAGYFEGSEPPLYQIVEAED